jgi:hypothetical protein
VPDERVLRGRSKSILVRQAVEPPLIDAERAQSLATSIREAASAMFARVMKHRERYIRAWIASTGVHPEECVLEERHLPGPEMIVNTELTIRPRFPLSKRFIDRLQAVPRLTLDDMRKRRDGVDFALRDAADLLTVESQAADCPDDLREDLAELAALFRGGT